MEGSRAARGGGLTRRPRRHPPQPPAPQDGADPAVKAAAMRYMLATHGRVRVVHHGRNATAPLDPAERCSTDPGRPGHMLFLLRLFLECLSYPSLLVLRDDARLAPDALSYFAGAQWLAAADPSVGCVSGASGLAPAQAAADPRLLLRSDTVGGPAAGWLVTRGAGRGVLAHWREAMGADGKGRDGDADAADDVAESASGWRRFLNAPELRRGRQCIVPDLARVGAAVEDDVLNGTLPRGPAAGNDADTDAIPQPPTPLALAQRARGGGGGSGGAGAVARRRRRYRAVDFLAADLSWLQEPEFSSIMLQVGDGVGGGCGVGEASSAVAGAAGRRVRPRRRAPCPSTRPRWPRPLFHSPSPAAPQKLVAAKPATAAEARGVRAGRRARRVRYSVLADYKGAMVALGLPADVAPGRYCFRVPSGPSGAKPKEHCQVRLFEGWEGARAGPSGAPAKRRARARSR
jgi:hypothetical protein